MTPCQVMVQASKQFTGMFQQGRDRVGSDYICRNGGDRAVPTTNFQSALGYTNSSGTSVGASTASLAPVGPTLRPPSRWPITKLYKTALPGALNLSSIHRRYADRRNLPVRNLSWKRIRRARRPAYSPLQTVAWMRAASRLAPAAIWQIAPGIGLAERPTAARLSFSAPIVGLPGRPIQGPVGALTTSVNGVDLFFSLALARLKQLRHSTEAPGCGFVSSGSASPDVAFIPSTDYWSNPTDGYRGTLPTVYVAGANRAALNGSNLTDAVFNLADAAASFARHRTGFPGAAHSPRCKWTPSDSAATAASISRFCSGMANDPNPDPNGAYPPYPTYNQAQPVGQFLYSPDATQLQSTFIMLASQILRISR